MSNNKDMMHYESEETLIMSLMNEGWTREYAERLINSKKEDAFWQGQEVVEKHFPEIGELP